METNVLVTGLILGLWLCLTVMLVWRVDAWRASVAALHLKWEREQRQASSGGVSLEQRQLVQARFEELVAVKITRTVWMHLLLTVAVLASLFVLTWRSESSDWTGLWFVAPMVAGILLLIGYAWLLVHEASPKLPAISASLYGPAPPRVKVKNIRSSDQS